MTRSQILLISLLLLLITGCRKNFIIPDQKVYFQMDYVNYAWGFQHDGFIIDMEGNVLVYDNPDTWNFPDENMSLTHDEIAENLSQCRHSGIKVPDNELVRYASYIPNIASSKLTAPRQTMADAGSIQYLCFQLNETETSYKSSLVKMEGDWSRENLNFYSKRVVAWMKEIEATLPKD